SGHQREAFAEALQKGNKEGIFVSQSGDDVKVPEQQLLRDVSMCWDSVFFMIRCLHALRPICDFSLGVDYFVGLPHQTELKDLPITSKQWAVRQDFEAVLMILHQVRLVMAKEATPILSGAIPAFETFMTSWEALGDKHAGLRPFIEVGLDKAREYHGKMDRTHAYIIATGTSQVPFYSFIQLMIYCSTKSLCLYDMV
ncbi:hypothetical protein K439DRAFT_1342974, partial [Ramaria rubella]